MHDLEVTRFVRVDPGALWRLVSDVDRWDELLPTIDEVTRLSAPGPVAVGARFRVRQPGIPTADYEITDWRTGTGFTWESSGLSMRATASHVLDPVEGGTSLTVGIRWSGPAAWLARALLARKARGYLQAEADAFARLAEARPDAAENAR